jgi:hypothetical protein
VLPADPWPLLFPVFSPPLDQFTQSGRQARLCAKVSAIHRDTLRGTARTDGPNSRLKPSGLLDRDMREFAPRFAEGIRLLNRMRSARVTCSARPDPVSTATENAPAEIRPWAVPSQQIPGRGATRVPARPSEQRRSRPSHEGRQSGFPSACTSARRNRRSARLWGKYGYSHCNRS